MASPNNWIGDSGSACCAFENPAALWGTSLGQPGNFGTVRDFGIHFTGSVVSAPPDPSNPVDLWEKTILRATSSREADPVIRRKVINFPKDASAAKFKLEYPGTLA